MTDISGLAARFIELLERRDWDAWAPLLHPDVVYDIAQTGERIRGRANYLRFNQEYPGDWHLHLKRTITENQYAVTWCSWTGGGDSDDGETIAFLEYDDQGLITHITDFWPEPFEPPPGREHLVERPGGEA